MLPLVFVPTYAIVAFAKTVFIVIGVGLIHGLFFLPVLLCAAPIRLSLSSTRWSRSEKAMEVLTNSSSSPADKLTNSSAVYFLSISTNDNNREYTSVTS